MSEKKEWYYLLGNEEKGPHSEEEILNLISKGEIASETKLRSGEGEWIRAGESMLKADFTTAKEVLPTGGEIEKGSDLDADDEILGDVLGEGEGDGMLDEALDGISDVKDLAKSGGSGKLVGVIILLAGIAYFFIGGSNDVDFVRDSHFESWSETTIGNAFDTFFDNSHWESFETENKTLVVEFVGDIKEGSQLGIWTLPVGAKFSAQFTILPDDDFELSYMASPLVEGGEAVSYSDEQMDVALDMIYVR